MVNTLRSFRKYHVMYIAYIYIRVYGWRRCVSLTTVIYSNRIWVGPIDVTSTWSKMGFECLICRMLQNKILVTSILVRAHIVWYNKNRNGYKCRITKQRVDKPILWPWTIGAQWFSHIDCVSQLALVKYGEMSVNTKIVLEKKISLNLSSFNAHGFFC